MSRQSSQDSQRPLRGHWVEPHVFLSASVELLSAQISAADSVFSFNFRSMLTLILVFEVRREKKVQSLPTFVLFKPRDTDVPTEAT